ncbi:unnamed protein product [Phytomonas sp. EM1]|nr:unnamed protein product [Phytomonas sp. EM1]|eukprot:CCW61862.1 unnamed protein product [Phytomonas sp. isolate EM1]
MFRRVLALVPLLSATAQVRLKHNSNPDPIPQPNSFLSDTNSQSGSIPSKTGVESVQVTRLQDGARIISHDVGGAVASIGAYILAGPVFESANCPGLGAMLQSAFAMHGSKQADLLGNRAAGGDGLYPRVHKYYINLHVNCRRDEWHAYDLSHSTAEERAKIKSKWVWSLPKTSPVRDIIMMSLTKPPLSEAEVNGLSSSADARLKELRWQRPTEYAKLALERVAFYLEPLGSPRYVPVENAPNLTFQVLREHYDRYTAPPRIIIAGVNVDHDALIIEYENALSKDSKPSAESPSAPVGEDGVDINTEARQYTGGELHDHEDRAKAILTKPFMDTETICAVGWLAFGRTSTQLRRYASSLVTKALLDVVLTNDLRYNTDDARAQSAVQAFYTTFYSAGLLGLTLTSRPEQAPKMFLDVVKLVQDMKNPSQEAVNVAKLNARVSFLNENTVNVQDYCDFLCNSLFSKSDSTMVISLDEVLQAIESVSIADVKEVIDMMLSHPTSFYGHGEMLTFPSIRQLGL